MKKERIDKLLHEREFADSRTKARAMIMAGVVLVDDTRVVKPSETFAADSNIRIKGQSAESKYVGRGGLKLEHALETFDLNPTGFVCLDVGSSTGGFTDCLLQHGASHVTAVDAGTNQLAWPIRIDPRVDVRENTNARGLNPEDFGAEFDLIVMDVSFISVTKIIPALVPLLNHSGRMIILIKPQFEVGKGEVGKGGIVRDEEKHLSVIRDVNAFAARSGLKNLGLVESPILGAEGNKEFFALYEKNKEAKEANGENIEADFVEGRDFYFDGGLMVLTAEFLKRRGYCCHNSCRHCPYSEIKENAD